LIHKLCLVKKQQYRALLLMESFYLEQLVNLNYKFYELLLAINRCIILIIKHFRNKFCFIFEH